MHMMCGADWYRPFELREAMHSFNFLFALELDCLPCDLLRTDSFCNKVYGWTHGYELLAILPGVLFIFGIVVIMFPCLFYLELTHAFTQVCRFCHLSPLRSDEKTVDDLKQYWQYALRGYHDSTVDFLRGFVMSCVRWPLLEIMSTFAPLLVQAAHVEGWDCQGEIMLMVWGVFNVACHIYFKPFSDRVVRIHNLVVAVINAILLLIPGIDRYMATVPENVLHVAAVIGVFASVIVFVSLILCRLCVVPDEAGSKLFKCYEEDVLLHVLDEFLDARKPPLYEQLIMAGVCARYLFRKRTGLAVEWMRSPLWNGVSIENMVEVMSRITCHPEEAMRLNDELHYLDPSNADAVLMPDVFPTMHDQLRVLKLLKSEGWWPGPNGPVYNPMELLREYIASEDDGAEVCHRILGKAGMYFIDNPRAFLKLLLFHRPHELETYLADIHQWKKPADYVQPLDAPRLWRSQGDSAFDRLAWLDPEYPNKAVLDFFKLPREDCIRLYRAVGKAWAVEPDKTVRAHAFMMALQTEHRDVVFQWVLDLAEQLGIKGDAGRMVRVARLNEKPLMWVLTRPEFHDKDIEKWWLEAALGDNAKLNPYFPRFMKRYLDVTPVTARFAADLAISRQDQNFALHIVAVIENDDIEVRRLVQARYSVRRQFPHSQLDKDCLILTKFERATTRLEICRRGDCAIALGMESFTFPLSWYLASRPKTIRDLSENVCWE
jgi:hypothetical protein